MEQELSTKKIIRNLLILVILAATIFIVSINAAYYAGYASVDQEDCEKKCAEIRASK